MIFASPSVPDRKSRIFDFEGHFNVYRVSAGFLPIQIFYCDIQIFGEIYETVKYGDILRALFVYM